MIEVRIRHVMEAKAKRLCDWPAERLDDLIPTLNALGVIYDYEDDDFELTGTVVVTPAAAFFEVLLNEPEEQ